VDLGTAEGKYGLCTEDIELTIAGVDRLRPGKKQNKSGRFGGKSKPVIYSHNTHVVVDHSRNV